MIELGIKKNKSHRCVWCTYVLKQLRRGVGRYQLCCGFLGFFFRRRGGSRGRRKTLSVAKLIKIRLFQPSWEDDGHNELFEMSVCKPVVMLSEEKTHTFVYLFQFHLSVSTYVKFIYLFISFCKT